MNKITGACLCDCMKLLYVCIINIHCPLLQFVPRVTTVTDVYRNADAMIEEGAMRWVYVFVMMDTREIIVNTVSAFDQYLDIIVNENVCYGRTT